MERIGKIILSIIAGILVLILVAVGGLIGIAYATQYRPADIEPITIEPVQNTPPLLAQNQEYKITTFNIGYGALGKEQDFFMDGGKNSGAFSENEVLTNMNAIDKYINATNSDFVFLQEVDISGKRSFNVDELAYFRQQHYSISYGINYDVFFVPVPITNPHGDAKSGIATLAKTNPFKAERYDFAGEEPFPKGLFDLQRCFTITRYAVAQDKELVLINAHFSAFDKGGKIREQQLAQMQNILIEEEQKGNYVILGGDFNHELPGTSSANFTWTNAYPEWCKVMDENFLPVNYSWAVDGSNPSIRANNEPYTSGKNFLATIDGFAVSNNIKIKTVATQGELNFEHSDHNPVEMVFELN